MPKYGNPFTKMLPRNLITLFGAHNLKDPYEFFRMALPPRNIQVHEDWSPDLESYDADIAIVTFQAGAIPFSSYVQPICLWNDDAPPIQTEGNVAGWGQSQNLEKLFEEIPTKLKVPIHSQEFCFLTTKDLVDLASNRTFCAGSGDETGICTGDSGGGVSIKVGSTFYFRGIVSSGLYDQISCDVTKFSIFTDVLKFKPWIDQIISENSKNSYPQVVRGKLKCYFYLYAWLELVLGDNNNFQTCIIQHQEIDGEGYTVAGDPNLSIQGFNIERNKEVKFLPENIVESFPELIAYRVNSCLIRTINGKHFKGLTKLESLSLSFNEIKSIDGDSFKDLTKLGFLDLVENKIQTIDPNLLQPLETLKTFHISFNQIEFLDENIFDNLQDLREIMLEYNKLSTIPASLFKKNLKLEKIWLNGNKIQTISSTVFDHLKNLTSLSLNNNICVDGFYRPKQFNEMKNVLSRNCRSRV